MHATQASELALCMAPQEPSFFKALQEHQSRYDCTTLKCGFLL